MLIRANLSVALSTHHLSRFGKGEPPDLAKAAAAHGNTLAEAQLKAGKRTPL